MSLSSKIIKDAIRIHQELWTDEKRTVSESTKLSNRIHKEWQSVVEERHTEIKAEVRTGDDRYEKIDVINYQAKDSFELKVSGKNLKHEIYKDIMKMISHNLNYPEKKINHFYFISQSKEIKLLSNRFDEKLMESIEDNYRFRISLIEIKS